MTRVWLTTDDADPQLPAQVMASAAEVAVGTEDRRAVSPAMLPFAVVHSTGVSATDTTNLQAAYAAAPAGSTIAVKGDFTLTSQLSIPSNTVSDWSAATIRRGYSVTVPVAQATKYTGALIRQTGTSGESIKIQGGFIDSNGFDGPLLAFYGVDGLTLSDIDLDYTGAGDWAVTIAADRFNVSNVNPRGGSAVFEDGIHIVGGSGSITGCHVESGDDMVALTTFSGGPGPIRHVTIGGITGTSQNGHLFRIDVASGADVIEHVEFVGGAAQTGTTSNSGMLLINATTDRQKMRHISVTAATVHCGGTPVTNPRGIHVLCGYDIRFNGVQVGDWPSEQLYLDNVDQVWVKGTFRGKASSTLPTARILSSGRVTVHDSALMVGASGTTSPIRFINTEYMAIMNCDLLGVPNGTTAVYVDSGNTTLQVEGCRATVASGTAHGVRVVGALSRLIYAANDFTPLGGTEIYPANLPATMQVTPYYGTATASELVSDTLTTTKRMTQVEGQSGAADNLATIRLISGLNGYTGQDIVLMRGGEDITVKHGTGNIRTRTAADVVMTSTANTVMHFVFDGTWWVQL